MDTVEIKAVIPPIHPQTRRHLVNAERLRRAAVLEFAQHGLHGAKVSSIVASAGLSQPSFYRMWPSKEAAYDSIVEQTNERWRSAACASLNLRGQAPLALELEEGVTQLFETLTSDLGLTRLVLHANSQSDQYSFYVALYAKRFEALQRFNRVRRDLAPEVLAQAYTALTERFLFARLMQGEHTPRQAAHELMALLLPILNPSSSF